MKLYKKLFLLLMVLITAAACLKVKNYPETPEVHVLGVNFNSDSTATLIFNFTDGDGDIGLAEGDTFPPYDPGSEFHDNLFIKYFELQNGEWINTQAFSYRVQPITPKGRIKVLEGEMEVNVFYGQQSPYDTVKYSVQLVDKALRKSNISESVPVLKP